MGAFQIVKVEKKQPLKKTLDPQYGDMSTVEAWLRRTQHLTAIAVTDAASVKAFLGRWKAIENRLLKMPALLTEMSHLRCLSDNTMCRELLEVFFFNHHSHRVARGDYRVVSAVERFLAPT